MRRRPDGWVWCVGSCTRQSLWPNLLTTHLAKARHPLLYQVQSARVEQKSVAMCSIQGPRLVHLYNSNCRPPSACCNRTKPHHTKPTRPPIPSDDSTVIVWRIGMVGHGRAWQGRPPHHTRRLHCDMSNLNSVAVIRYHQHHRVLVKGRPYLSNLLAGQADSAVDGTISAPSTWSCRLEGKISKLASATQ